MWNRKRRFPLQWFYTVKSVDPHTNYSRGECCSYSRQYCKCKLQRIFILYLYNNICLWLSFNASTSGLPRVFCVMLLRLSPRAKAGVYTASLPASLASAKLTASRWLVLNSYFPCRFISIELICFIPPVGVPSFIRSYEHAVQFNRSIFKGIAALPLFLFLNNGWVVFWATSLHRASVNSHSTLSDFNDKTYSRESFRQDK